MSEHQPDSTETVEWETLPPPVSHEAADPMAVWEESYLTARQFFPDPEWINRELLPKGKGTQAITGRFYGDAYGWEETASTTLKNQDGSPVLSIRVDGNFEGMSLLTGELQRARSIYLPKTYALRVRDGLEARPDKSKSYPIQILVGVEATGKTIPYRYGVLSFVDDESTRRLAQMRASVPPSMRRIMTEAIGADRAAALIGHDKQAAD